MTGDLPSPDTVLWTAHPAAQRPRATVSAVAVIAALAAGAWLLGGSVWWAVGSAVFLCLALNRFLLPSRFTMDAAHITARHPLTRQSLQWSAIRRFALDGHGGYLSTRAARSRLDGFRGMHLLFDNRREQIVEQIRRHIASAQAPRETTAAARGRELDSDHPRSALMAGSAQGGAL